MLAHTGILVNDYEASLGVSEKCHLLLNVKRMCAKFDSVVRGIL